MNLTPAQVRRRRWFWVESTFYELRWPLWEWLGRVWLRSPGSSPPRRRHGRGVRLQWTDRTY